MKEERDENFTVVFVHAAVVKSKARLATRATNSARISRCPSDKMNSLMKLDKCKSV